MVSKNKDSQLTAAQLEGLPISIGEARKLLGIGADSLSDDDVAQQILCLQKLAISLLKPLPLQK